MKYQRPKGTIDFIDADAKKIRYIENETRNVITSFGFEEVITPIFEHTEVFTRSVGDDSDIVNKEMYTFLDKGKRSITLRPEGTAGVVRSYLENKMYADGRTKKVFYSGPMFRYERPQSGRFRQFNQFGVEAFGDGGALLDADVILSAWSVFERLNIKMIQLRINTIGDNASRANYSQALEKHFSLNIDTMCEDCKRRLTRNPMRILDCKVDKDHSAMINAPEMSSFLTRESMDYFQTVLTTLDQLNIPYIVDSKLVRGLDYYTDTVFEFVLNSNDELNGLAICAGGKYANLVENMGGPVIPGVGYAFGLERILAIKEKQKTFSFITNDKIDISIIALDLNSKRYGLKIASMLRNEQYIVDMDYKNFNLKPQFRFSEKKKADYIIILGEEEQVKSTVTIKNIKNGTQKTIPLEEIIAYIKLGDEINENT